MALPADIASDLALIDGLYSVTLLLIRTSGTTSVSIASAQRESIGKNVANYGGYLLQGGETVWHIPDNLLNPSSNGRVINAGDEITHGSTVYIVTAIRHEVMGTVWGCVCNTKL